MIHLPWAIILAMVAAEAKSTPWWQDAIHAALALGMILLMTEGR